MSSNTIRRVALIVESAVAPRRRMLAGVARYIHEHDPWAIYLKPVQVEKSLQRWLDDWSGDGIIASVNETDGAIVIQRGVPVVDVVGVLRHEKVPLVHANDSSIGRVGAEHLLERGFRNFGFCEYPEWFFSRDRRDGFRAALQQHGHECHVHAMRAPGVGGGGPGSWEGQQQALVEWIQSLPKPVGVMTSTDLMGQQFLEACQRAGVIVPEQVAVVGADNDELICDICFPPLSSVIINDEHRGYQAAAVLDQLMSGKPPPSGPVYIEPTGVVSRASTDILAIDDQMLAKALRFVRERACDPISVEDVVRAVPLSRSVLERRFRKVVGRTINDEIIRIRLNRAVELLSATQLELKAVAYKSGFGSPSYMGAVFRERLGRTPGSYREQPKPAGGQIGQGPLPER